MEQKYEVCMTGSPPWGFRLAGGADFDQQITIGRVTPGSLAFQHGIRDGDLLLHIDGHSTVNVTHLDVQSMVKQMGAAGQLRLSLARPGSQNQYRPSQFSKGSYNYNQPSPKTVMGGAPQVQHLQYNSPIGLYSSNNVYTTLKDQTQGVGNEAQIVMGRQLSNALGQSGGQDYDPTQSETFRLLQQTEREKQEMGSNNSSHANLVRSYSNQREPSNDHAIQSMSFRRLQKETDYNEGSYGSPHQMASGPTPVRSYTSETNPRNEAPAHYNDKNTPANQMQRQNSRPSYLPQQPPNRAGAFNKMDNNIHVASAQQPFSTKFSVNSSGGPVSEISSQPSAKWQPTPKPPQPNSFVANRDMSRGQPNVNTARQSVQSAIPAIPRQAPTVPASVRDWKRPEASAAPTSTPAGNDGTAARNPSCEACQGVIRGPFVTAVGKNWHPDCFKCNVCGINLQDEGFVQDDSTGQLLCEQHYNSMFAPPCYKCGDRIVGDVLHAIEKTWHAQCFVCTHCKRPFGNAGFHLEEGMPYCEEHWNEMFTSKCEACQKPIQAGHRWLEALNVNWHAECFKCATCMKRLEGETFFSKSGKPYCREHHHLVR
ncbi:PDZ and LIM domain protein 7-like [Symsagittifera roscoffensis]|uniref:PDZ and LIM domain protein 7-like n=1 Tax=Symsagittifera roscoffensis TaxID=84072 RepID=UPI00307BD3A1